MKRFTVICLLLFSLFSTGLWAQSTAEIELRKGQDAYVRYESERDNSGSPDAIYHYLYESYKHFVKVLELPDNGEYAERAKNRLRNMYPVLFNATQYFNSQMNPAKTLNFASAYIDVPQMQAFRSELLPQDAQYPTIVFLAASRAQYLKQYQLAEKYFKMYLNLPESEKEAGKDKSAHLSLSALYNAMRNFSSQEEILLKASAKYPKDVNILKNLVNVYVATKNDEKLLNTYDQILAVNPNDDQILIRKADLLRKQDKFEEALPILKRLHTLYPNELKILRSLAITNYSCGHAVAEQENNVIDQQEIALIRQKATPYFSEAQFQLQQFLVQKPTDERCMIGLANTYKFLGMTAESEVLFSMIQAGENYAAFDGRLVAYNEAMMRASQSNNGAQDIPIPINPPMLTFSNVDLITANNDKIINAGESIKIKFTLNNSGLGDAYNIRLRISEQNGYDQYFDGTKEIDGGNLEPNSSKEFEFSYIIEKDMPTSKAIININAFEANKYHAQAYEIVADALEYAMPKLKITDYRFTAADGTSITVNKNGTLTVALQNFGTKTARNLKVKFEKPESVYNITRPDISIDSLAPGEHRIIDYTFSVTNEFFGDSLAVMLSVNESTNSSNIHDAFKVKMGEYLVSATSLDLSGTIAQKKVTNIQEATLRLQSELLEDIPVGASNPNRYALIIGNEDYKSHVRTESEINVPYAIKDAVVFQEYCLKSFGIPEYQISIVDNATHAIMGQEIDRLLKIAQSNPQAEIFFYYSGHGCPDKQGNESFLLPVDVKGESAGKYGISLSKLYDEFAKSDAKIFVFLDACFSGGHKSEEPLLAQKGVKLDADLGMPDNHTISFASSRGTQTSNVYHAKQQGYFTYFLLKTLQEAKGDITMGEWFDRTADAVKKEIAKENKEQEPMYDYNPVWSEWKNMKLVSPVQ